MAGNVVPNTTQTTVDSFDPLEEEGDFFSPESGEERPAMGLDTVMSCTKVTKLEQFVEEEEEGESLLTDKFASAARRPLRGIQIKKESIATLYLKNKANKLANSSVVGTSYFTTNFLVNSLSESRQEKHQSVLTFGKDYVYFFGEQPRQITVNATLINSANFRWEEEWWYNYEKSLRGTKLAASNSEVILFVDTSLISGFLISANTSKDASNPHVVNLSFVMHVTEVTSTREDKIGSHLILDEGSRVGNVDLNMSDSLNVNSLEPIYIGESGREIRDRNLRLQTQQEASVGAVSRFINSAKEKTSSVANDFIDFLYGRNIVIPADSLSANFASGSAQVVNTDSVYRRVPINTLDNTSIHTGAYTDNFDEYPFQSAVFEKKQKMEDMILDPYEESAKLLKEAFGLTDADLYGFSDNKGIPKFSGLSKTLSKGAFAVTTIGVATAVSHFRKKLAETPPNPEEQEATALENPSLGGVVDRHSVSARNSVSGLPPERGV